MENNLSDSPGVVSDKPCVDGRVRSHRSAVSNGTRLFGITGIDGRTQSARRFRDIVDAFTADLGGVDLLSEAQRQLIRRASALSLTCEAVEADMVRDMPFDIANYLTATNSLRRVLETLGLARVAKDVGTTVFRIIGGLPPPPMQTQSNGSLSLPEKESVVSP
jgi:hypothetical protein